jgi:hypothetical protein
MMPKEWFFLAFKFIFFFTAVFFVLKVQGGGVVKSPVVDEAAV